MKDFTGQTAIITGGTRGIGKGIVEAFLKAGATVITSYVSNDAAAESMKSELKEFGEKLDIRQFDVSKAAEVENFFQSIDEKYKSVEILVNNSGVRRDSALALMSDEDWKKVLDINLGGTFYMTKSMVPRLLSQRYGRIINISSVGGSLGLPGQANYAASKAGQIALSRSLAKEVGRKGITVNNVCPGFIDTELIADLPEEQRKEYMKQVPVRKFGTTADVANAVLFLASKDSSYITGTTLEVTGGL